ncbi:hypothetical protein, partial [Nocardia sp. CC201C]|uniref:hypothetical protein n=1 Tax=Nocardia sp. CC201C TaxID=3044575 RepID=UPI0024A83CAC
MPDSERPGTARATRRETATPMVGPPAPDDEPLSRGPERREQPTDGTVEESRGSTHGRESPGGSAATGGDTTAAAAGSATSSGPFGVLSRPSGVSATPSGIPAD